MGSTIDASRPVRKTIPTRKAPAPGPAAWFALSLCLVFVLQGLAFIPYVGIQNDEALFGAAIYEPVSIEYKARILGHMVPTMVMTYIGALKAWVYTAIFAVWPPSPYSLRVPVLVIGAITIWLFFLLLRDTAGKPAALAGAALLAFDTTFLLTNTFDWGPVAFQHLLLLAALWALVRFHKCGRPAWLGAGFFILGLGLWDKALFAWILGGLVVAGLIVFPREIYSRLSWRNAGVAAACFLIGCWPLVGYNKAQNFKTFRENTRYSTEDMDDKLSLLRSTLDGSSLYGYIVHEEPAPVPGTPASVLESWSVALGDRTDERQHTLMGVAFVLALALLPLLWVTPARKPILFALILMLVAWLQMAFTYGAGGSPHHVVLLWPFPHLLIAVAFARASGALRRAAIPALAVVIAVVCGSSFLVTNRHFAQLIQFGSGPLWTDAIYPLADYVEAVQAERVYVMDWGVFDGLRILQCGRLPLMVGSDQVSKESMDDNDRRILREILSARNAVFVGHTDGNEVFTGVNAKMREAAEATGYRKKVLKVIADRMGRPMFEVYRLVPGRAT